MSDGSVLAQRGGTAPTRYGGLGAATTARLSPDLRGDVAGPAPTRS